MFCSNTWINSTDSHLGLLSLQGVLQFAKGHGDFLFLYTVVNLSSWKIRIPREEHQISVSSKINHVHINKVKKNKYSNLISYLFWYKNINLVFVSTQCKVLAFLDNYCTFISNVWVTVLIILYFVLWLPFALRILPLFFKWLRLRII